MKVIAALWFESPGAYAENKKYPSICEVRQEFYEMIRQYNRLGGAKPVGAIYRADNTDYPIYTLEVSDRGSVKQVRA